jgi:hypothetical protein
MFSAYVLKRGKYGISDIRPAWQDADVKPDRHCERSEAIQRQRRKNWIASLRSSQ